MHELSQTDFRRRLHYISTALRSFGLVDRYGLCDLVRGEKPPTRASILRQIKSSGGRLPPSIEPELLADVLIAALLDAGKVAKHTTTANLAADLSKIPPGPSCASAYHRKVFNILKAVFADRLTNGRVEQEINEGRKRIDIVFNNGGSYGFFHELSAKHRIFCPYIYFECKNYKYDVGNPEFDQLQGRFHNKRGNFGVLACRKIDNKERALKACRDVVNSGKGYILLLEDSDFMTLTRLHDCGESQGVDGFLDQKYFALVM